MPVWLLMHVEVGQGRRYNVQRFGILNELIGIFITPDAGNHFDLAREPSLWIVDPKLVEVGIFRDQPEVDLTRDRQLVPMPSFCA